MTALKQSFEDEPPLETFRTIQGARVAWANEQALLRDFPDLAHLIGGIPMAAGKTELDPLNAKQRLHLDQWLLKVGGLMSDAQLASLAANDPIAVSSTAVRLRRPLAYGRAAIVDLATLPDTAPVTGLMDIKGCGVRDGRRPAIGLHSTGLMVLPEALGDLLMQLLIERALQTVSAELTCVPVYAVLNLGFWASPGRYMRSGFVPAAMMLRAARPRYRFAPTREGFERQRQSETTALRIELLLRHFGIMTGKVWRSADSAEWTHEMRVGWRWPIPQLRALFDVIGHTPEFDFTHVNIQMCADFRVSPLRAELIDFGQFSVAERFEGHVLQLRATSQLGDFKPHVMQWANSDSFIQPDPRICIRPEIRRRAPLPDHLRTWCQIPADEHFNGVRRLGLELSKASSDQALSPQAIERRVGEFVGNAFAN